MQLPIEDIYSAGNGAEALALLETAHPHIVITDIKMPLMDGLDFIARIKESGAGAKIIILSGYGEFSYAQRAISLNVSEYLLKPIKKDKLCGILVKVMDEIRRDRQESEMKANNDKKIREYYLTLLKEILEGYENSNDIDYIFSSAGLVPKKAGFAVYSIYRGSGNGRRKDFPDNPPARPDILFRYTNRYNHRICLANIEADEYDTVCLLLKEKLSAFAAERKADIYAGISEWKNSASGLSELVRQAEKALDFRMFKASPQVFRYEEIKMRARQKPVLNVYYEEMQNAANQCDMHGMDKAADRMFDFLLSFPELTPGLFKNSIAGYILYFMPPDRQNLIIESINNIEDIYQLSDNMIGFRIRIKEMLHKLSMERKGEAADSRKQYGGKINAAIKYIEENYDKNLYLESVANHINMNTSYFSNSFKKTTGMYFSDYLQKIRIEKAKALLMQPRYKIYEVAENTGFLDEKYFFKVFKKLTGVTPTQYRNGIHADGD